MKLVLCGTFFFCIVARAAPVVDSLFPAGGQRGTSVEVKLDGKFDAWPVKGWADAAGIAIEAGKEKGALTVRIDKSAAVGPHLIRVYDDDGASAPRVFIVGDAAEVREAEPNDEPRQAQAISATQPVTIEGQLEKSGDVDCYAVRLEAGEQLVAAVQGRRLGAPMDPMLHVLDAEGDELAFAHDGLGLDPLLAWRCAKAGTYIVRVSAFAFPPAADVKLAGGKGDVYRLTLTTGPAARFALPAGVRRGERAALRLVGWNVPSGLQIGADATARAPGEDRLLLAAPSPDGWVRAFVGDGPELLADEARRQYAPLAAPVAVSGVLATAGEEHRFKLAGKKGEPQQLIVRAGSMHSPMDALVRVEDGGGKELGRANGAGLNADAVLNWTPPADGIYRVAVADLFRKGGEDYVYRLEIGRPQPGVSATVDNHAYRLAAGKSAAVKVTVVRRDGQTAPLVVVATGLPAGVSATSAEVPEKGGEVTLTLSAAADVKAAGGVLRVMVLGVDPARPETAAARYELRKEKDTVQELIESADPWLTVVPGAPATAPASQPATKPGTK